MKQFKQIFLHSKTGMSLIVLAFSIFGLFNSNGGSDDMKNSSHTTSHPSLTSEVSDNSTKTSIEEQESVFVADGDTVVVKSFGTDLSYDITEIRAKAGSTITIRYENTSDMPHNIVLVKTRADIQPVGVAGIRARDTGYVPQDAENQERILYSTDLAKPGSTVHVTMTVPEPGTYPYICTYPGHFTMMQGDLISEA